MDRLTLDAYVAAALFDRDGYTFALGDGTVVFEGGARIAAHDGAVLCAVLHPSGKGVLTGGDDGRLVWSRRSGATEVADTGGKWIDAVAASAASGLVAFAAGRDLYVRDVADAGFARSFRHERAVSDVAFDPKGRRVAASTYGGAMLWYARIADQKPTALKWAGAHTGVTWSPDGRFVVTCMQENDLHGWRLSDGKDMRMSGYPSKVKSTAFLAKGALLATAGAPGAVCWRFTGANGPMGSDAVEVGFEEEALVARVAAHPAGMTLVGGLQDGRVWSLDLNGQGRRWLREERGPPITALAVSGGGDRAAWGDEAGAAGVAALA